MHESKTMSTFKIRMQEKIQENYFFKPCCHDFLVKIWLIENQKLAGDYHPKIPFLIFKIAVFHIEENFLGQKAPLSPVGCLEVEPHPGEYF